MKQGFICLWKMPNDTSNDTSKWHAEIRKFYGQLNGPALYPTYLIFSLYEILIIGYIIMRI